ncbi:hypothetical protein [Agrobacterium bohemicum]|uniref:Uncharacterized protein n=1 Tax=Agrobacterium bohemicum TaxID=2052828 RepID=A0A135P6C6_9HYPH|nr:hypothetical protein [Agrobacterium bohemicum]KXG86989.1 hypothetical protein ATO67_21625 [Agrobacterium bohemicum]
MQFLPFAGVGKTAFDIWVRDERLRLLSTLGSLFMDISDSPLLRSKAHADLKRAAVLLLEANPLDHCVRQQLSSGLGAKTIPATPHTVVMIQRDT